MTASDRPHRGEAALLVGLLGGKTLAAAAQAARISESTARRIVGQPRFRQALSDGRGRAIEETVTVLSGQATRAAQVLVELAEGASQEHVRLSAATRVLELALKARDQLDIEQRLASLEAAQAASTASAGTPRWGSTRVG